MPVYLAAVSGPSLMLVVFWIWFGLCKNGVINLMHECAHLLTFRRRWANELLGSTILAPLVITDFFEYRRRHWEHHRHLGTPRDAKTVYHTDIRGGRRLASLVFRSLLGVEAFRRLTERPADRSGEVGVKHAGASLRLVAMQATFLASIAAVSFMTHPSLQVALLSAGLAYGFVYGYGLASLTVLAAALRAIAEHQIGDDASAIEGNAALRNLRCNAMTRLIFGAYGFGEHATHHSQPGVPYYQLPSLTLELVQTDPAMEFGPGYLATLAKLSRGRAPLRAKGGVLVEPAAEIPASRYAERP